MCVKEDRQVEDENIKPLKTNLDYAQLLSISECDVCQANNFLVFSFVLGVSSITLPFSRKNQWSPFFSMQYFLACISPGKFFPFT